MHRRFGTSWGRSCTRLPPIPAPIIERPVTFPPGRAKLSMTPNCKGAPCGAMTIGMVRVASMAAVVPIAKWATMARNVYICPMGKLLKTTGRILSEHMLRYIASTRDCGACPLKSKCCPNTPARMIPRDVNEDARDTARALSRTEAFEQSRRDRKRVEMLFAHLKRMFRLNRLRLL